MTSEIAQGCPGTAVRRENGGEGRAGAQQRTRAGDPSAAGRRMLALVIDDSRAIRSILTRQLGSLGFDVAQAGDGAEALAVLDGGTLPGLILIDWNMPVMDGLSFVEAVRDRPELRETTLMMVTTESEQRQIVRALEAGVHEYVTKPFTEEIIAEKLSALGLVGS